MPPKEDLEQAGVSDTPAVLLADAGYWHQRQMENIIDRGIQVLIPPDAGKRKGTRPGWDGGAYAHMRRVLQTDFGLRALPKTPGNDRAGVRTYEVQPPHRSLPTPRKIRRASRVAANHRDPQPLEAPRPTRSRPQGPERAPGRPGRAPSVSSPPRPPRPVSAGNPPRTPALTDARPLRNSLACDCERVLVTARRCCRHLGWRRAIRRRRKHRRLRRAGPHIGPPRKSPARVSTLARRRRQWSGAAGLRPRYPRGFRVSGRARREYPRGTKAGGSPRARVDGLAAPWERRRRRRGHARSRDEAVASGVPPGAAAGRPARQRRGCRSGRLLCHPGACHRIPACDPYSESPAACNASP